MDLLRLLSFAIVALGLNLVVLQACNPGSGFGGRDGYVVEIGRKWYKFFTNAQTWHQAQQTCGYYNAHLAVINTSDEERLFVQNMQRAQRYINNAWDNREVWIGVYKSSYDGQWKNVNGRYLSDPRTYANWGSIKYGYRFVRQPDNHSRNENCASLVFDNSLGFGMNDVDCDVRLAFVCERLN